MADINQTRQFQHPSSPEIRYIRIIGCESNLFSTLLSSYLYNLVFHSKKNPKSDFEIFSNSLQKFFSLEIDKNRIIHTFIDNIQNQVQDIRIGLNWCLKYCAYYSDLSVDNNFPSLFRNYAGLTSEADICNLFKDTFKVAIKLLKFDGNFSEFNSNLYTKFMILKVYEYQSRYYMTFTQDMIDIENGNKLNEINNLFNSEIYIKSVIPPMPAGPPGNYFTNGNFMPTGSQINLMPMGNVMPGVPNNHPGQSVNFNTASNNNQATQNTSPTKINPQTKISNRYKIENFDTSPQILQELSVEYSSCVTISDSKNQIRAFAYNLSTYLNRFSNDAYVKTIISNFQNKHTMTELNLKNSISLKKLDYENAVECCEEVMKEAAKCSFIFPEFKSIRINEDIERDFNTIELLSMIFGVTSIMIVRNQDSCTRIRFNLNQPSYNANFHFFATERDRKDYFKVYVIFTKVAEIWDGFDYERQKQRPKESIIVNKLEGKGLLNSGDGSKQDDTDKLIGFFKSMSELENVVIKSIVQSIRENNPVYLMENINENINLLKSNYNQIKKIRSISSELGDYELLSCSAKDLNTYCHYCGRAPDPQLKNFYSTQGCFFHFDCMNNVFLGWYDKCILNESIEKNEIPCPKCLTKTINALSFLVFPEKAEHLKKFKVSAEKKTACCLCAKIVPFDFTQDLDTVHCEECICKIHLLGKCPKCNNPNLNMLDAASVMVSCLQCGVQTFLCNIRINRESFEVKCKKCWVYQAYALFTSGNSQQGEILIYNVIGRDSLVNCNECEKCFLKAPGDIVCPAEKCENKMCIICFYGNNINNPEAMLVCPNCGIDMVNNALGYWQ